MNIKEMMDIYQENGYDYADASAKVCQDVILLKLANSKFSKNITIKGGVVMHNISKDKRRATRDLVKYSLEDTAIIQFIDSLNKSNDDIEISIFGKIKPLHHQDYDGKRVFVKLIDKLGFTLETKLDIGVHKLFDIDQDDYCFNFDIIGKNANLLINSKEQIFAEKLKSLLKLGVSSTRYKDLFDFYYLINETELKQKELFDFIKVLILEDEKMRENSLEDIVARVDKILNSIRYKNKLSDPKVNWLQIPVDKAIENVLIYLQDLEKVYA